MSKKTAFSKFSYFEAKNMCGKLYGSCYPSINTTVPNKIPQIGERIFNSSFATNDLYTYLNFLKWKHFGFNDNIGWLIPYTSRSKTYNASKICEHLETLSVVSIKEKTIYDTTIEAKSNVFNGSVLIRLHTETLPQKAIDTSVYYVDSTKSTSRIATTLGYKRKSDSVNITFNNNDNNDNIEIVELLSTGLYGHLYGAGEHIEAKTEGRQINKILIDNIEEVNSGGFVLYKDIEIANRGLLEEVGITVLPGAKSKFYVYGIHNKQGRDSRYHEFDYLNNNLQSIKFGYLRPSETVLVASIIKGVIPKTLPDPTDIKEVMKARLVPIDIMIKEFTTSGKFKPAFESHVEQFHILMNKLDKMINVAD